MSPHPVAPANGAPAPLGFPRQRVNQAASPPAPQPPVPKRPKGRWFIGITLLVLCSFAAYKVWDSFFRYQAHGTVQGRIVQLSPPWDGVIQYVHVREGEEVRQGQVLMTVDNVELRQRQLQLTNELKVAQATLAAEIAKLKWQAAFQSNNSQKAVSEYYQAWGNLMNGQAMLEDLKVEMERTLRLNLSKAVPERELTQLRARIQGVSEKVEKLKTSVAELKDRAEHAKGLIRKGDELGAGLADATSEQLKPYPARIEAIQDELAWIHKRLEQSQVCAPTNGVIVKLMRYAGEYCKADQPMLMLLEHESLQIVLYLPQNASTRLKVGDEEELVVLPYDQRVCCKVVRVGDAYAPPPDNIELQYWTKEKLLPVYLEPSEGLATWMMLRPNAVVRLPYRKPPLFSGAWK
jgi:multidrug resistance efflux pump